MITAFSSTILTVRVRIIRNTYLVFVFDAAGLFLCALAPHGHLSFTQKQVRRLWYMHDRVEAKKNNNFNALRACTLTPEMFDISYEAGASVESV